jgi:hypothetical protein
MRKILITSSLILFGFLAFAQSSEATVHIENEKVKFDTSRIESHYDKLAVYLFTIRKFRTFELKSAELDNTLKFEPNGQTNVGLGFNYKWDWDWNGF